jgi:hypothetical protein
MAKVLNNEYGTNLSQETRCWQHLDKTFFDKKNKDDPDKKDGPFIVVKKERETIKINWKH